MSVQKYCFKLIYIPRCKTIRALQFVFWIYPKDYYDCIWACGAQPMGKACYTKLSFPPCLYKTMVKPGHALQLHLAACNEKATHDSDSVVHKTVAVFVLY